MVGERSSLSVATPLAADDDHRLFPQKYEGRLPGRPPHSCSPPAAKTGAAGA